MEDFEIPKVAGDLSVEEALAKIKSGWVGVAGKGAHGTPAIISVGALKTSGDLKVTLGALVAEEAATYVVPAEPRTFSMLKVVRDRNAWKKSIIVIGEIQTMPKTCPKCGARGHGLPCTLLP
jgi:hypothetical protein